MVADVNYWYDEIGNRKKTKHFMILTGSQKQILHSSWLKQNTIVHVIVLSVNKG